jgi:hypothetical protein
MNEKYHGESRTYSFSDYVTKHIGAASLLALHGEPLSDTFHKQLFVNNIKSELLSSAVKHIASSDGVKNKTFRELQNYFQGQLAQALDDRKKASEERTVNQASGKSGDNGKKRNRRGRNRKANKAHQGGDKYKSGNKGKNSGNSNGRLAPEVWKALPQETRDVVLGAMRNARKGKSTKNSDDKDDSEMSVEPYPNIYRNNSLVGSKIAKREKDTTEDSKLHVEIKPDNGNTVKSTVNSTEKENSTAGAGLRFGRANIVRRVNMMSTMRHTVPERTPNTRYAPVSYARAESSRASTGAGYSILDSGADTVCVGDGFKILSRTGRTVSLRGFDDGEILSKEVEVVTAATAWEDNDGTVFILVFNEALDLGRNQRTSLICPNQLRYAGHQVDDIPQFLSRGRSIHGIKTVDEMYIPFDLSGKTSYLATRLPTPKELDYCEYIELTGDAPWDPEDEEWEEMEQKYTRSTRHSTKEKGSHKQASEKKIM